MLHLQQSNKVQEKQLVLYIFDRLIPLLVLKCITGPECPQEIRQRHPTRT